MATLYGTGPKVTDLSEAKKGARQGLMKFRKRACKKS